MDRKMIVCFGLLFALVSSYQAQTLAECNRKYEYERTCSCNAKFSRDPSNEYQNFLLPVQGEYSYCDNDDLSYHDCFKGNCIEDCDRIIRDQLEFDENTIDKLVTQSTGNHFCEWTKDFIGESVTEGGLRIFIESTPGLCDRHYNQISHDICCFKR